MATGQRARARAAKYRRVTAGEDAAAHKAKRYTRAAPGKFKAGATISRREYQELTYGGQKIEAHIRASRKTSMSLSQRKAIITRARNKELKAIGALHKKLLPGDSAFLNKYILEAKNYTNGHAHFANLSASDKKRFRELFMEYPQDLVRSWLGSSEENRAHRMRWNLAA